MTAREKMRLYREAKLISEKDAAFDCGMSDILYRMVEGGHVTHPKFVENIKRYFHLTNLEAEELLPKNRRKHDPEYDPDRYVTKQDMRMNLRSRTEEERQFYDYVGAKRVKEQRCHSKRS